MELIYVFRILNHVAMVVVAVSSLYFFVMIGMGLAQLRRRRLSLGFQSGVRYRDPFQALAGAPAATPRLTYFLIACLNEAEVIGDTVRLLRDPSYRSRIVVVNDDSSDDTARVAQEAGGDQIRVLTRTLPNARQGKGAALNIGYQHIVAEVAELGVDPDLVLVCVMDADGHLSTGCLGEVLPIFDDPTVGGVQLAVRIRNRRTNFLTRFQDYQFWTQSALSQFGRMRTGTVSLGGNGQFARLSALLDVGATPWSGSLTEDLDLTVSLQLRGWRTLSAPRASVDQQGLPNLKALLRQRTRWYQGHMMTGRRIPEILRSREISDLSAMELICYLISPWVFDVPWSVLYHLLLIEFWYYALNFMNWGSNLAAIGSFVVVWYVFGFWPALLVGFLARRRDPRLRLGQAFVLGHSFVVMNYMSFICAWRAVSRILRGKNSWAKTDRIAEHVPQRQVAAMAA